MSVLSSLLRAAAAKYYPDVVLSSQADFLPMADLNKGEMSSSAAIEIARATKQNAHEIALRLIALMSQEITAAWRSDLGYIVCANAQATVMLAEVCEDVRHALDRERGVSALGEKSPPRAICILIPDATEPTYAHIRLVARAFVQALLTVIYEGQCRVVVMPGEAHDVCSVVDLVALFQRVVRWILSHEGEDRRDVQVDCAEATQGALAVLWTTHHYHERLGKVTRQGLADARKQRHIALKMPADGWLLSRDRALSQILGSLSLRRIVEKLTSDELWLRFLFHAASSVPSGDFDPAVALFDECSSLRWSLQLLRDRYARFERLYVLPVSREDVCSGITDLSTQRPLMIRALHLPVYTARAIAHAEVGEWCMALEDFSRLGHSFLNTPQTRLALEKDDLLEGLAQIVASLGFGLSSILELIVEGSCADQ